ncbi:uncharacterized protein LOC111349032, partial [Spodoptera litura]|uniref:Uncharacterized protein LOC111349032 n=1 Tax=Spodoptera litura TaxID=69820 RepID=A0A9J7DPL9_SPOLT
SDYHLVNYSDCFNPSLSTTTPCPALDKLMTKILGYYIFRPNGAKAVYASTTVRTTKALRRNQRRYTPEKTRKIKKTTTCSPCERNKKLLAELEAKAWSIEPVVQSTTKKKRNSGPVKRSRTEATIVLKKETVWKNGKMMHKVVKGFKSKPKIAKRTHDDSDFLENLA